MEEGHGFEIEKAIGVGLYAEVSGEAVYYTGLCCSYQATA
jgi:hypothetical protein